MPTDQYRQIETITNEHKRLLQAWEYELSNHPTTKDIKTSKNNTSDQIQFTLMNLFNTYLNQTWADSQSMLQYAESRKKQNINESCHESIFYTSIVGLHMMKQSLQTRQAFFKIIEIYMSDDNNKSNTDESVCFASSNSSTLSDHSVVSQNVYSYQQEQPESFTMDWIDPPKPCDIKLNQIRSNDSVSTLDSTRPIRLTSSPSTPTMRSNVWADQYSCPQKFAPACNYTTYFPRMDTHDVDHKLFCHFCQEALPFKKSFSVENLNSFQQNPLHATDDESEKEDTASSFEIASFYYNSDPQEDVIEREELLEGYNNNFSISEKYQLLSDTEEDSLKIEIEQQNDNSSASSSIIYYDVKSKQLKKNKIKRSRPRVILYEQDDESSTVESSCYSEESSNSSSTDLKTPILLETKSMHGSDRSIVVHNTSLSNKLLKSKVGTFIRKASTTKQDLKLDSSSITRSNFSSRNINLCHIFSTRKVNLSSTNK